MVELIDEADGAIAQRPALALRQRVDVAPADLDDAGIGPIQSAQDLQQRGLARAGSADDRQPLAARDPSDRRR